MSESSFVQAGRARRTVAWTFAAMMARELLVIRRKFLVTFTWVILQPLLFVFVFVYVMPKIHSGLASYGAVSGSANFSTILISGLVASNMTAQGITSVVLPLGFEFSPAQRSINDRAMAPLPITVLAVQKIMTGATQALISGLLVFPIVFLIHPAGQGPQVNLSDWPVFIIGLIGIALISSSAGLLLGTIADPQAVLSLLGLLVLPMTMLGCVYYPWSALHSIRWLQLVVLVNPLVYSSEALRGILTPQVSHMPIAASLTVLIGGTIGLGWLAARKFTARVLT